MIGKLKLNMQKELAGSASDDTSSNEVSDETGNPQESTDSDPSDISSEDMSSGQSGSDKFGGDYQKLLRSYQSLESKLGSHGHELGELRQQLESVSSKAQIAHRAAEALAARDGISVEDALDRISREAETLRGKYGQKIEEQKVNEDIKELRLKLERQELLAEYPESKSVLDTVLDVAKATGRSPKDIYEKRFKNLVAQLSVAQKQTQTAKPVFRGTDTDEEPSGTRTEKDLRKRLGQAKTQSEYKAVAHELLKHKLFGKQT